MTTPTPGTLPSDRHCAQCRYNLRGLDALGNCPECGHPIVQTLWDEMANLCMIALLSGIDVGLDLRTQFDRRAAFASLSARTGLDSEALEFVHDCMHTLQHLATPPLSHDAIAIAQQFTQIFSHLAHDTFGPDTPTVLRDWNLATPSAATKFIRALLEVKILNLPSPAWLDHLPATWNTTNNSHTD